ncbi:MAG: hypothetical protein QM713_13305 [Arachnia sp.]
MKQFPFWSEIPASTPLSRLLDQSFVALPPDHRRSVVATVTTYGEGTVVVRYARLPDLDAAGSLSLPDAPLGKGLLVLKLGAGVEFVAIPPVEWPGLGEGRALRVPVTVAGAAAAGVAPLLLGGALGGALALPAAAAAAGLLWTLMRRRRRARIRTAGDLHLDGTNLVDYAIARRLGQRPDVLTDTERRERIGRRIDDIRADYGRRAADIVYRIENSALFDSAVPTTNALEVALVRCDVEAAALGLDELDDLATDLEIAYAVALDHAETVGFQHLPETARADARRAHKAAQLAAGATTDGERAAAAAQVIRILGSLALYYLPAPEAARRALTAGHS